MPNKRKEGKRHVGLYADDALVAALESVAKREGTDKSTMLKRMIEDGLRRRGITAHEKAK